MTSNFSFSHSVFKSLVLQTRKNQDLFGKGEELKIILSLFIVYLTTVVGYEAQ